MEGLLERRERIEEAGNEEEERNEGTILGFGGSSSGVVKQ